MSLEDAVRKEGKVLIVDDNANFLHALTRVMEEHFEVDSDNNGFEAFTRLIKSSPEYDAVIIDQNMPGMTGLDLLQHMKKVHPSTQWIVITGDSEDVGFEAGKQGAFAYLRKPSRLETIISITREAIIEKSRRLENDPHLKEDASVSNDLISLYSLLEEKYGPNIADRVRDEIHYTSIGAGGRRKEQLNPARALARVLSKKILVVNDDKQTRTRLEDILKIKYNVITCGNLEEAKKLAGNYDSGKNKYDIDLAIIDLDMPSEGGDFKGLRLVADNKDIFSRVPSIITTNRGFTVSGESFYNLIRQIGTTHCFQSPIQHPQGLTDLAERTISEFEKREFAFHNHAYLVMGPSCAGKNDTIERLIDLLTDSAVFVTKCTTRSLRKNEEGKVVTSRNDIDLSYNGKVFSVSPEVWENLKKNDFFLQTYTFAGEEYGIFKPSVLNNLYAGKDVFLLVTELSQLDELKKKINHAVGREAVVPILIYADYGDIMSRLTTRRDKGEAVVRSEMAYNQVNEYQANMHKFLCCIKNSNVPEEEKPDKLQAVAFKLKSSLIQRLRKSPDVKDYEKFHRDYVDYVVDCLFKGTTFEQLRDQSSAYLMFNEEDMRITPVEYREMLKIHRIKGIGTYKRKAIIDLGLISKNLIDHFTNLIMSKIEEDPWELTRWDSRITISYCLTDYPGDGNSLYGVDFRIEKTD